MDTSSVTSTPFLQRGGKQLSIPPRQVVMKISSGQVTGKVTGSRNPVLLKCGIEIVTAGLIV